ncbi:MAG TPA: hypothetical protein DD415_01410 [Clostridiales bacterium]|nr:hypothetical protein [Clostridiales bacterium]
MILTKIYQKGNFITEKFALLNLLKALGSLSGENKSADGAKNQPSEAAKPAPEAHEKPPEYNAMASVIERHEAISNRVRSKK